MARMHAAREGLTFHPLTPDRWPDFEKLFGSRGACGGCWCMLWRTSSRAEFEDQKGDGNRKALKCIVEAGEPPGILAYQGHEAVGWCSVAPRASFPGLERSRVLKPIDATPVWSITCLFVAKSHRKQGVSVALLKAAIDHVRRAGGVAVEGYPVEPQSDNVPAVFAWTGLVSAFEKAGFIEAARGSASRPIMRFRIRRR